MGKQIENNIRNILGECRVEGTTVFLPPGQLDRKTYTDVNKCLEGIGGKWNRKAKGHVFDKDPSGLLDTIVETGEAVDLKKEFQFFPTPPEIVQKMLDYADVKPGDYVLEPSAGAGAILREIVKQTKADQITAAELNPDMAKKLQDEFHVGGKMRSRVDVYTGDFLSFRWKELFDKVLMNPPFTRLQDVDHILHAFDCLKPGGTLVAIASESPFFRSCAKAEQFRQFLYRYGATDEQLPEGAFKTSGTNVRTRLITVSKPV